MTSQQIVDFVFEIAPNPSWADENIFEFGGGTEEVTAVGIAWWITSDIMRGLGEGGFQLGLTRGTGPSLLKQLEWDKLPTDWSRGVPVIEIDPMPLRELNRLVKTRLNLPFVRYDGEPERIIRRIAVSLGGMRRLPASWGGSWCAGWDGAACASPLGFDAIIGGDLTDGLVRFARENDWAVIDAMHHSTEMQVMRVLTRRLQDRFPNLRVEFFANSCPWQLRG